MNMNDKDLPLLKDLSELTSKLERAFHSNSSNEDEIKVILGGVSNVLGDLYIALEKHYESDAPEIVAVEQCESAVTQVSPTGLKPDQKDAIIFALQKLVSGPANRTTCDEIELSFLRADLEVPTFGWQLFGS